MVSKGQILWHFFDNITSTAHSVTGGNAQLPQALVKASRANINLNSRVQTITNSDTEYSVTFTNAGVDTTIAADAVVLAVPIEWTGKNVLTQKNGWLSYFNNIFNHGTSKYKINIKI